MNSIKCKYCGKEQPISEALEHELSEQIAIGLAGKHQEEIERIKKEVRGSTLSEVELKLKDKSNETEELKNKNKALQDEVLQMSKAVRELKETMDRQDIENQKKLNEEIERLREQSIKIAMEKSQGDMAELRKQLDDTKKALESANYKLSQTSQQLQGEVLELDLEKILRETFVYDEIVPVNKGVQGADIIHKVKGQSGRLAGIILWETKDAKWSPAWLPKLREDGRGAEATIVVLACKNPPKDITSFQIIDGVLVTSISLAIPLAWILRRSVLQIAVAKQTAANKDEKLEFLYDYLQSEAFRHRFESFAEGVRIMQEDLNAERRAMEKAWKRREVQIQRLLRNAARMYGELQGVMGNALPEIKVFSLPDTSESEDVKT